LRWNWSWKIINFCASIFGSKSWDTSNGNERNNDEIWFTDILDYLIFQVRLELVHIVDYNLKIFFFLLFWKWEWKNNDEIWLTGIVVYLNCQVVLELLRTVDHKVGLYFFKKKRMKMKNENEIWFPGIAENKNNNNNNNKAQFTGFADYLNLQVQLGWFLIIVY